MPGAVLGAVLGVVGSRHWGVLVAWIEMVCSISLLKLGNRLRVRSRSACCGQGKTRSLRLRSLPPCSRCPMGREVAVGVGLSTSLPVKDGDEPREARKNEEEGGGAAGVVGGVAGEAVGRPEAGGAAECRQKKHTFQKVK